MELQEIFNKAHKHLAGMAGPSMDNMNDDCGGTQCVYRGVDQNGNYTKCVVGAFIPDELYDEELEGDALDQESICNYEHGYHDTRVTEVLSKAFGQDKLTDDQYLLLAKLQSTHDRNADDWRFYERGSISWYEFIKPALLSCANDFKLETGEI